MEGNTSDYNFKWSPNVSTTNVANDLLAATYTVTICDAGNPTCFTEVSIVIGNVDGPVATLASTTDANCGMSDGSATLLPATYTYTWDSNITGNTRNDLAAGTYEVTVTEAGNTCSDIIVVEIGEMSDLLATPIILSEPTCGEANGSVVLDVRGGSGIYNYSWGPDSIRTDLIADYYLITITCLLYTSPSPRD